MTAPRQVLPGTTYLVTRRCSQRQFLLRPSRLTNQLFFFLLALASRRFSIRLHAFCVLSNHFHLLLTDPLCNLPAFHQFLDSLVARSLNSSLGRWEAFWAPGSFSAVSLSSPQDILDKASYLLANPVAAGLVRKARLWPGLWSSPDQVGTTLTGRRPDHFFDPNGYLPETVSLELSPPPGFSVQGFREQLAAALEQREELAARDHPEGFLGVARVLSQDPTGKPKGSGPRRKLNPRVAARDKWKRLEVLGRLVAFLRAYREAWLARRRGEPSVLFPAGTYLLRVAHGVPCAGAG
jgi:REP element-mobilizing transposase RayT